MAFFKSSKHLFFILSVILATFPRLSAESGIYDRIGIISEHGLHGAVPEENIDLFTGNLTLKNLDIHLPGPNGFDLNIWRVYNSKILKDRLMGSAWGIQQEPYSWVGIGWSMHMGRLHSINTETPVIEYPDGRWETAYHDIDNYATFITRDFAKLDKTNWKLYFKDGTIWTFGALANVQYANMVTEQVRVVTLITNSYGHQINITYDASGSPRMKTITDSMGRTVDFIIENKTLNKLNYIAVKNASGTVVYYDYTVDEFNGDYYKLTTFAPPVLPAVTYEYGNGLTSNWELLAVNTSYGGRMEYEYADQTFYYQVYALDTKVVHEKRIKFGSDFKTWTYSYPSYYNSATGTVTITGPAFTTYATYHAYTAATPWKIGLLKEKSVSDGSSSEQYEWTAKTISDTRWYVLNIDMGQVAAPLMQRTTKNRSGDSRIIEEYLYERTVTSRIGLPTRNNIYGGGSLKNYRTLEYYFEDNPTFTNKNLLGTETLKDSSNTTLKQTIMSYYTNGALNLVQKWRNGSTYLTWDYGYSSSNPNYITIIVDLPGTGGTETMIYRYGVLATMTHPTYTEFTRSISTYDSSILSETNQHGATMGFTYDNLGRITAINMPSGFNAISASWSPNSVTITQGGNSVFKYWDGMGRDTGYVEQGDGINLYYRKSLDSEGRTVAESKGSTVSTDTYDYFYNDAGQIKKITDPREINTNISLSGNQKTVTDANSHATTFAYSHLPGLVTSLTDPAGKSSSFSYDGSGRLLSTIFNSARTQSYTYNGLDQVTTETHPETGTITYAYNADNNLETKTWGGKSTAYTYNASNQLLTENGGDETITYAYDSKGRVFSITGMPTSGLSWSKTSITYNSFGAVTHETITIPGLSAKSISYSHDANNQLAQITYPDGRTSVYSNNGLNMPETIAFNGSTVVNAVTYGIGKQPTSVNISANGTSYAAAYNSNGNLTTAQLKKGSAFLYDADYGYDGVGNITSLYNSTPTLNATYSYDARNRLNGASYTPSGTGRVNNFVYTYDDYGNMTLAKENSATVFYQSYTNKNQIDGYSYDSRGNLTSNPIYNYTWDNRNRLSQITNKLSGIAEGAYAYDEKGIRLKAVRALIPELALATPNGGENWVLGTAQAITWSSKNIGANLKLELLKHGIVLGTIIENLAPATNSYAWTAGQYSGGTAAPGSGYAIRISSMDGACTDTSDGTFTFLQAQLIVSSPNGGESWQANSTHDITWTANFTGGATIDLYKGGLLLSNIGTALSETGKLTWTLSTTLIAAADYKIRIYQGTVEDYSDNDFSITAAPPPTIAVTYPNGGETLGAGASVQIKWTSTNLSADELINVEYSLDAGGTWSTVGQTQNSGQISWSVPQSPSATCLARVSRVSNINGQITDQSDAVFTIVNKPLLLLSPNGVENWQFGLYKNITWSFTGLTSKIAISLYRNGVRIGWIANCAIAGGTYSWKVGTYEDPQQTVPAGSGYAIEIKTMTGGYVDTSDGTFTIFKSAAALTLTSPAGGEALPAGSEQAIAWTGGEDIRELKIEYSTDLGSTYRTIASRAPNTGSYLWQVPETVSAHCLVRISDANGQLASENTMFECDLAFAIKSAEEIAVEKPLLSLWFKQTTLAAADPQNLRQAMPLLALSRSELDGSYQLNFGEYSVGLENSASLFEKPQQIKVQWDIMNSRGTLYLNQKPVFKDIPLPPANTQIFAPCLNLRTGDAVSTLRLDDFQVSMVREQDTLTGKDYLTASASEQKDASRYESVPVLNDDFESYQPSENLASGGWQISQTPKGKTLRAEVESLNLHQGEPAFAVDSQAPISGLHSGKVAIPANTSLTLTKPISLPERVPFAVSKRAFSIIRATIPEENKEKEFTNPDERELKKQIPDANEDLNLKGPNADTMAATTPVSVLATLYGTTYYIYSYDGKLLAEYDATGVCVKDYIYLGSKLLAEYQPVTATKYYYASDQINSTRIITNSAGTVVYSALFDPYGGMQKQWVNTYKPSLKFSGKERESKSEMDYFGARYYDHLRYRFISVDPIINKDEALTNPQLWNLYAYCRNNPITYLDPDGSWSKEVHDKIIDTAFPGNQNENMRNIFKEASAYVDNTDQSISGSYKHAMRAPWQTAKEAEIQMNQFLTEMKSQYNIMMSKGKKYEAYFALGMAMHALMDSTSPIHEGFQMWGNMDMFNSTQNALGVVEFLIKGTPHLFESSISSKRMEKSVRLIQNYLKENQK